MPGRYTSSPARGQTRVLALATTSPKPAARMRYPSIRRPERSMASIVRPRSMRRASSSGYIRGSLLQRSGKWRLRSSTNGQGTELSSNTSNRRSKSMAHRVVKGCTIRGSCRTSGSSMGPLTENRIGVVVVVYGLCSCPKLLAYYGSKERYHSNCAHADADIYAYKRSVHCR